MRGGAPPQIIRGRAADAIVAV